ncbi:MAG: transcription factor S [Thermoplasmatales archaeon]|nr:transcription factor S [Thermoplasmatales archaeon]
MMFPKEGIYVCRQCGNEEQFGKAEKFTTNARSKETIIVSDTDPGAFLPKTRIKCPECSNPEAYYTIRQTRSADEPETRIYRCCKCQHSWREY